MDGQEVFFGKFPLKLPHGFHEGLTFHIADSAADLGDDHIIVAGPSEQKHPPLDLVGDMRDDLDRFPEVRTLALLGDDGMVDFPRSDVIGLGCMDSQESFVVPQVQVCLSPVFSHIAFAVLIGIEGARIDVDVRVEFLNGDSKPSRLQKFCKGSGDNALAQ